MNKSSPETYDPHLAHPIIVANPTYETIAKQTFAALSDDQSYVQPTLISTERSAQATAESIARHMAKTGLRAAGSTLIVIGGDGTFRRVAIAARTATLLEAAEGHVPVGTQGGGFSHDVFRATMPRRGHPLDNLLGSQIRPAYSLTRTTSRPSLDPGSESTKSHDATGKPLYTDEVYLYTGFGATAKGAELTNQKSDYDATGAKWDKLRKIADIVLTSVTSGFAAHVRWPEGSEEVLGELTLAMNASMGMYMRPPTSLTEPNAYVQTAEPNTLTIIRKALRLAFGRGDGLHLYLNQPLAFTATRVINTHMDGEKPQRFAQGTRFTFAVNPEPYPILVRI